MPKKSLSKWMVVALVLFLSGFITHLSATSEATGREISETRGRNGSPASTSGRWIRQAPRFVPDSGKYVWKNKNGSYTRQRVTLGTVTSEKKQVLSVPKRYGSSQRQLLYAYTWTFRFAFDAPPPEIVPGKPYTLTVRASGSGDIRITETEARRKWNKTQVEPKEVFVYKGKGIQVQSEAPMAADRPNYPVYWMTNRSAPGAKSFTLKVKKGLENSSYYKKLTFSAGMSNCRVEWDYVFGTGTVAPAPPEEEDVRAPGDCGKGAQLTRYLGELRSLQSALAALERQVDSLRGSSGADDTAIGRIGADILTTGKRYQAFLQKFLRAETRKGLYEELNLMINATITLNELVVKYQQLKGLPVVRLQPPALEEAERSLGRTVLMLAKHRLVSRLKSEGLQDILVSSSWDEALEKAAYHTDRKVREFLERETQRIFGLGFHDLHSAKRALRLKLRREIYRQVAKLLVKVTSNEIVIELVAGPIVRWIGRDLIPRLREALRHKGHLKSRVEDSILTMKNARRSLFALPCSAKISEVQRQIGRARGTLHAARFLEKDIRNAGALDEKTKLEKWTGRLEQAIHITESRFILGKDDIGDDMVMQIHLITEMLKILDQAVRTAGPGTGHSGGSQSFHHQGGETADSPFSISQVAELVFYEGGFDKVPMNRRRYHNRFTRSATRYVYWELNLGHKQLSSRFDFAIDAEWKNASGQVINRYKTKFYVPVDMSSTRYSAGFGKNQVDNWAPGVYSVTLFMDGREIASGTFEITGD